MVGSIISVLAFIVLLFYGFVPESPRFLCMKGRIMEARSILENAALLNRISKYLFASSKRERTRDCNSSSSSLSVIFSLKLIRTNLLLRFLYFGNTFSYYGIILLTSELSSGESKCADITLHSAKDQKSSLYIDVFLTSLAVLLGLILSAFVVDKLGRKFSMVMVLMFVLGLILLLPLLSRQNEILTTTLLFGIHTFISETFSIACIYAPEVCPTNIRSTGVGIATAIGKIGGMVCPLVAVDLVNGCHQAAVIILFVITILLSGLRTTGMNLSRQFRKYMIVVGTTIHVHNIC